MGEADAGEKASRAAVATRCQRISFLGDRSGDLHWRGENHIEKDKNSRDRALNIACSSLVSQACSSIRLAQAANLLLVSTVACWPSVRARSDVTPPVYPECECGCLTSGHTGDFIHLVDWVVFKPVIGLDCA